MDALQKESLYTIDDIYTLPDGKRAELIDGQIYSVAPPGRTHQRLLHFFDRTIGNYIQCSHKRCEIYPAPFAVFLNKDAINYVEPDISVICDPSKLDEKGCHGAPDWIIEIVSAGNKSMYYFTKHFKYQTAGVREYWIVDPTREIITVYRFEKETMEQYSFYEDVPVGIYEDYFINLNSLSEA